MEAVNRQSGVHQLINRDHYYAPNRLADREMPHLQSSTPLAAVSPTSMNYPNHPPPPYSHSSSAPQPTHAYSGLISPSQSQPPDSRRTSSDVKDMMQSQRQSLPSIQEALLAPTAFARPRDPMDPSPARPYPSFQPYPPTPTSRANSMDTGSYQNASQPHRTSPPHPSIYQRPDPVGPSYEAPRHQALPSIRTALPTSASHHTGHGQRTEADPRAMGPLSAGYSHPSAPNGPHAAGSNPAQSPVYSPQSPLSQRQYRPRYDNGEEQHKMGESPATHKQYGPVVKRHLDYWDIEVEMSNIRNHATEIVKVSGDVLAISQRNNNHDTTPGRIPSQQDLEVMRSHHEKLTAALGRMTERVNAQGQYTSDQHGPPPVGKAPEDYSQEEMSWDESRSVGGYGVGDAKKRRGRAAPPGRCHSCNRAETPEWRRGPDGARTLCNACGLHYAKLTRKLGSKQAQNSSSSLRPTSMEEVSPRS